MHLIAQIFRKKKKLGKCITYIFSQLTHLQKNCLLHFKSIWLVLIGSFTKQGGSWDMWSKFLFAMGEKY